MIHRLICPSDLFVLDILYKSARFSASGFSVRSRVLVLFKLFCGLFHALFHCFDLFLPIFKMRLYLDSLFVVCVLEMEFIYGTIPLLLHIQNFHHSKHVCTYSGQYICPDFSFSKNLERTISFYYGNFFKTTAATSHDQILSDNSYIFKPLISFLYCIFDSFRSLTESSSLYFFILYTLLL